MAPSAVAVPTILTQPGYLFIAPLASTAPTNTVAGSVFTDAWPAAWLPLGATEDGSELSYKIDTSPVEVAEFYDPISYPTTGREGAFAFALASYTLTNFNRAANGGAAALTATSGTGATTLSTFTPPTPGTEVSVMLGWESLDNTLRMVAYQCKQGGEIKSAFKKAPDKALIACQYNFEVNSTGVPYRLYGAGTARLGT